MGTLSYRLRENEKLDDPAENCRGGGGGEMTNLKCK